DGRLGLVTLVELRDVLEEERLRETLDRAAGRSEDEVKALVAALRPEPEPAPLFRRLAAAPVADGSTVEPISADPPAPVLPSSRPEPPLRPIAPERHVLRIVVGAEFVADLEAVREELSHRL